MVLLFLRKDNILVLTLLFQNIICISEWEVLIQYTMKKHIRTRRLFT
nr:MAG TPA: hypothetical protein [Caudoviricetes sp.]